jgi:hypothetical protein
MIDNFAANDLYNCIDSLDSSDFQKFLAGNKSSILPTIATKCIRLDRSPSIYSVKVFTWLIYYTTVKGGRRSK